MIKSISSLSHWFIIKEFIKITNVKENTSNFWFGRTLLLLSKIHMAQPLLDYLISHNNRMSLQSMQLHMLHYTAQKILFLSIKQASMVPNFTVVLRPDRRWRPLYCSVPILAFYLKNMTWAPIYNAMKNYISATCLVEILIKESYLLGCYTVCSCKNRCSGGSYCLHHQVDMNRRARNISSN
jgi:hypothetical protein